MLGAHNRLVALRNAIIAAWAQVDEPLQRRVGRAAAAGGGAAQPPARRSTARSTRCWRRRPSCSRPPMRCAPGRRRRRAPRPWLAPKPRCRRRCRVCWRCWSSAATWPAPTTWRRTSPRCATATQRLAFARQLFNDAVRQLQRGGAPVPDAAAVQPVRLRRGRHAVGRNPPGACPHEPSSHDGVRRPAHRRAGCRRGAARAALQPAAGLHGRADRSRTAGAARPDRCHAAVARGAAHRPRRRRVRAPLRRRRARAARPRHGRARPALRARPAGARSTAAPRAGAHRGQRPHLHRRHQRHLHGRRLRAGTGLRPALCAGRPLPHRPARGEHRPAARRRRHAEAAARDGRGPRAGKRCCWAAPSSRPRPPRTAWCMPASTT